MANHKNFEWIILEKYLKSVLQQKPEIICLVLAIPIFDSFEWKSVIYDILKSQNQLWNSYATSHDAYIQVVESSVKVHQVIHDIKQSLLQFMRQAT